LEGRTYRPTRSIRLAALAGPLSLVCALVGLLPQVSPLVARGLDAASSLLVGVWFLGVFAVQRRRIGRLGLAGALAATLGIATIVGLKVIVIIAANDPSSAAAAYLGGPAVMPAIGTGAVLFVWGVLALGTASLETGVLPHGGIVLWTVGFGLNLFTQWQVVQVGAILGVLWTSVIMWRGTPVEITAREGDAGPSAHTDDARNRLTPLDALRGTIMALMAIDHASSFVRRWHPFETWDQPLPDYPSLAAMLTRLATHPCAPGFYFLMGAGMILFANSRRQRGWSERRIAGHLALRGLLFIVLEQIIVDLVTAGQIYPFEFSILSGLGVAMLMGTLFLRLRGPALAGVGAAILLAMQVIPGILLDVDLGAFSWVRLLLVPGSVGAAFGLYAPIPWLGVVLLGMAFARLLRKDEARAYRVALWAGVACLAVFVPIRLLGGFGNLRMPEGSSLIDFFNVVKYPPSLSFLLLTLGFDLLLLFAFSKAGAWLSGWARSLVTLGKAALYFFLVHWFIYRALAFYFMEPAGLPPTYLVWIIGLAMLYPVCKAFEAFKHRTAPGSATVFHWARKHWLEGEETRCRTQACSSVLGRWSAGSAPYGCSAPSSP
jgi:uncharacterized membrane protein